MIRSPLPWIGGKHYSAKHIIQAFPPPPAYDIYVDLFGGAAHVLIQKPPYKHVEVYNDINNDLVNFWMQCRDNAEILEACCRSLPYSRSLYYDYHRSLFDGSEFTQIERATRWFYVLRSAFSGQMDTTPSGWCSGAKNAGNCAAGAYHAAIDLFTSMQSRFKNVLIDSRDFADVMKSYPGPRVLFYVDPPYLDCEHYYEQADGATFTLADHERLAILLNTTRAFVALSYYPHPLLDKLYQASRWRRYTWNTPKHAERTNADRQMATELLLMNYPEISGLWATSGSEAIAV